ncbi:MAG: glycosyltransferase [Chloroflexi bacterium]|nr:glycosyltransferase [Chloroflexota bacterium]
MRIGVNATFLQRPATGMGQHLFHLLKGLDAYDNENTYILLSPRFRHSSIGRFPQLSERFQNIEVVSALRRFGEHFESLWWEQVGIVRACQKENINLLHFPYFAAPLILPAPTVVTVHDVIPLVMPEYRARARSRMYSSLVSMTVGRADAIITVSEYSKRDIIRTLRIPEERIHVIGNAVDASYRPITDARVIDAVRERYGIGPKYILYFGGFDLRKNVSRVLEAYARLPATTRAEYQLVIAGRLHLLGHRLYPDPRPRIRELGLDDSVVVTGQIREQDKAPLYSAATVYLFPSLYEGFGLEVLEAMACGAAVITSNLSALPEVAGDAARYVDPYNVADTSQAIEELLEDADEREELGRRALARAQDFSWRRVAEQTLDVYKQLAR